MPLSQVAAVPPPSSSVKTTLVASSLNVAECQIEKFSSSLICCSTTGLTGSLMSSSTPSPKHAPAARFFSGYAVTSWQPPKPASASFCAVLNTTGSFTTRERAGSARGTSTMEIVLCGGVQVVDSGSGPGEETYR
ncbi:hypothetical protein ACFQZ3_31785 [Thermocatellispora tengchongensis]|uniref:hypothetical protein n=1 Tax=Thermocatellispora tengchongensis TaxID=1073253 RepID=UPI0036396F12